jgi:hypothetical protein
MNERIRQLELEAIAYADSKVPVNDRYNDIYHSIVRGRFAELIVGECMECADIVGKSNLTSGYPNSTAHHIKQKIREHFGVEE